MIPMIDYYPIWLHFRGNCIFISFNFEHFVYIVVNGNILHVLFDHLFKSRFLFISFHFISIVHNAICHSIDLF